MQVHDSKPVGAKYFNLFGLAAKVVTGALVGPGFHLYSAFCRIDLRTMIPLAPATPNALFFADFFGLLSWNRSGWL
jgi:hypothetical protein